MSPLKPVKPDPGWSFNNIENSLRRIAGNAGVPLLVTRKFFNKIKGAIYDAARLQMLTTWARLSKEKCLHFHRGTAKDAALQELCDYAPGIAVLRLCEEVVFDSERVSRKDALAFAAEKMDAANRFDLGKMIRGRSIDLVCVSGAKVQYLGPLFSSRNEGAVRGRDGMFWTLRKISDYISDITESNKYSPVQVPEKIIFACATFVSELMMNTQEHATTDHRGDRYIEHVEGMMMSWNDMSEDECKQDFEKSELLLRFWEDDQFSYEKAGKRYLNCWQLSFFDTGPGFASRITGKALDDLSVEEERAAFLRCLSKNMTTKRDAGAGNGLPNVLNTLKDVGGLIKIRSGRLSVFNAFFMDEDRDIRDFSDWPCDDPTQALAPVAGVVISIMVPFQCWFRPRGDK